MSYDNKSFSGLVDISKETLEDIVAYSLKKAIESIDGLSGKVYKYVEIDTQLWEANNWSFTLPAVSIELLTQSNEPLEISNINRDYSFTFRVYIAGNLRSTTTNSLSHICAAVERVLCDNSDIMLYSSLSPNLPLGNTVELEFLAQNELRNVKVANEQFEYMKYFDVKIWVQKDRKTLGLFNAIDGGNTSNLGYVTWATDFTRYSTYNTHVSNPANANFSVTNEEGEKHTITSTYVSTNRLYWIIQIFVKFSTAGKLIKSMKPPILTVTFEATSDLGAGANHRLTAILYRTNTSKTQQGSDLINIIDGWNGVTFTNISTGLWRWTKVYNLVETNLTTIYSTLTTEWLCLYLFSETSSNSIFANLSKRFFEVGGWKLNDENGNNILKKQSNILGSDMTYSLIS